MRRGGTRTPLGAAVDRHGSKAEADRSGARSTKEGGELGRHASSLRRLIGVCSERHGCPEASACAQDAWQVRDGQRRGVCEHVQLVRVLGSRKHEVEVQKRMVCEEVEKTRLARYLVRFALRREPPRWLKVDVYERCLQRLTHPLHEPYDHSNHHQIRRVF